MNGKPDSGGNSRIVGLQVLYLSRHFAGWSGDVNELWIPKRDGQMHTSLQRKDQETCSAGSNLRQESMKTAQVLGHLDSILVAQDD